MLEEIIYVQLLDEGSIAFRPVPAMKVNENTYLLGGNEFYDTEDEVWEFLPGMKVLVEDYISSEGTSVLIAKTQIND